MLSVTDGQPVVVPGGAWLLKAQFSPQGNDLLLTGADGSQILIRDYFNGDFPVDLMTPGGAVISGELALKLAGPQAPGATAQATPTGDTGAQPIGTVETVEGTVTVVRTDGTRETLEKGGQIFQGDTLETGDGAAVGIIFADDSTFSLGEGGRMVIDEMVYDPATKDGSFQTSVVQGVFSFVSGEIAKSSPEGMVLKTPVATIGIRGTTVAGQAAQEGSANTISLLPNADGTVGELTVTNGAGTVVLNQAGATTTLTSAFTPPAPPVILSPAQIQNQYGSSLNTLQQTQQAQQ